MKKITGIFTFICLFLAFGCQKETNQKDANQLEIPSAKKPGPSPSPSIVQWQLCLGTASADKGADVIVGTDGAFFISGTINDRTAGYVMKFTSNNEPAWSQPAIIDGNGFDELNAMVLTADGGCLVTGFTNSTDLPGYGGNSDVLLAKIASNGTVEWTTALGTAATERCNAIVNTSDNGFALTGYSDDKFLVIKLDATGQVLWEQRYSVPGYKANSGYSILESDGNYVIAGRSLTLANTSARPFFAKLQTSDGTLQQVKVFENFTDGLAFSLTRNISNSGFVLAGRIGCEALVFEIDDNGNETWSKTYGGSGCGDMFHSIITMADHYVFAGTTNSKNGDITGSKGGNDVWMFRAGADGNKISSHNLGGNKNDEGHAIATIAMNHFIVVGTTSSTSGDVSGNKGGSDIWGVKVQLQ